MARHAAPFTGTRDTCGGGDPVYNIELDGHMFPGGGGSPPTISSTATAPSLGCLFAIVCQPNIFSPNSGSRSSVSLSCGLFLLCFGFFSGISGSTTVKPGPGLGTGPGTGTGSPRTGP